MTFTNATSDTPSSLVVRLIVGDGANAGVHADIREGFYMIGRDRECQIRPKSRSVGERHCLVQHTTNTVRVLDLNSEEGTFVNDEKLPPHKWRILDHGDRLRCGRYWFEVAIYQPMSDSNSDSGDNDQSSGVTSRLSHSEIDLFGDDQWAPPIDVSDLPETTAQEAALGLANDASKLASSNPKSIPSSRPARVPLPKPKIRYGSSWPRVNFSLPTELSWKIMASLVLTVAVLGYTGWSMVNMLRGPDVKVFRQPD